MTLLNIANDGYYNVLIALYRGLVVEGPTEQTKLIEICSNKTDASRSRLRQTLNRWRQLGLFNVKEDIVSLEPVVEKFTGARKDLAKATAILPRILRHIVFKEENNNLFWDREKSLSADLTRGLSYVLAQNIYEFPFHSQSDVQRIELRQVIEDNRRILGSDVSYNGLRTWASYLGFTWQSMGTMIDPTTAILQELPSAFEKHQDYPAETFIQELASLLPVLDSGRYRVMMEGILDPSHWKKPPRSEILSTSLSRALWRLETMGVLRLEPRADAQINRVLQRARGEEWKNFTHVIYQGESK
jgi:hypothetical protein